MLKDEDNFGEQKEQLFNRLAEGMKRYLHGPFAEGESSGPKPFSFHLAARLGSIYMRQSRHQEAVLILDKALKLRERDFDQFKDVEAATKIAQRLTSPLLTNQRISLQLTNSHYFCSPHIVNTAADCQRPGIGRRPTCRSRGSVPRRRT
jgi:hypothetical protein